MIWRWLARGRARAEDQAIALTKTPAPGAGTRMDARPVPGHDPRSHIPAHHTGGLDYAVKVWKCGCILLFDGHGRITGTTPCLPCRLDDELRELFDDQH